MWRGDRATTLLWCVELDYQCERIKEWKVLISCFFFSKHSLKILVALWNSRMKRLVPVKQIKCDVALCDWRELKCCLWKNSGHRVICSLVYSSGEYEVRRCNFSAFGFILQLHNETSQMKTNKEGWFVISISGSVQYYKQQRKKRRRILTCLNIGLRAVLVLYSAVSWEEECCLGKHVFIVEMESKKFMWLHFDR